MTLKSHAPLAALFLLIFHLAVAPPTIAQDGEFSINRSPLPAPTGFVNDFAGVISPEDKNNIETRLREFRDTTGVEIAVAVVRTTGERDIFDYSLAVARGWGIGLDQDDNPAALLFIAVDDRKYFTHVSKDLEDELPDGLVGDLQRRYLVPEFRKGNYGKGIADTVEMYIRTYEARSSGSVLTPTLPNNEDPTNVPLFSIFCCLAIMLFLILVAWSNRNKRGKSDDDHDRWGGGGFGGGGGALPWIILGGSGSDSSSSSSSWDWGGGGGSDWGGFGGGGDFGGGGAGGDW